jgi:FkbM family methyltransferase
MAPPEALAQLDLDVREAVKRLQRGALRDADFIAVKDVKIDGDANWIEHMLTSKVLHEPDFAVFGRFTRDMGTILDVGANWGYSVGSMRAAGTDCPIVSFEVLAAFEKCLAEVKNVLGKDYDYVMSGVGDSDMSLAFYTPVVDGGALTALTTANPEALTGGFADNVVDYVKSYRGTAQRYAFQFLKSTAQIRPIDGMLRDHHFTVPINRIAAMKIDVEGLEAAVLRGAQLTIERDHPFLMLEGGNRITAVADALTKMDYRVAEFRDGALRPSTGMSQAVNGYFWHASHDAAYRKIGLLAN